MDRDELVCYSTKVYLEKFCKESKRHLTDSILEGLKSYYEKRIVFYDWTQVPGSRTKLERDYNEICWKFQHREKREFKRLFSKIQWLEPRSTPNCIRGASIHCKNSFERDLAELDNAAKAEDLDFLFIYGDLAESDIDQRSNWTFSWLNPHSGACHYAVYHSDRWVVNAVEQATQGLLAVDFKAASKVTKAGFRVLAALYESPEINFSS